MSTSEKEIKKEVKKEIKSFTKELDDKERLNQLEGLYQVNKRAGLFQCEDEWYDQSDLQTPTYKKMGLSKQEAVLLFLDHRYLGRKLLAEKYGVERLFPSDAKKQRNIIERIYADIRKKPDEYKEYITKEEIEDVATVVSSRVINNTVNLPNPYAPKGLVKSVAHIVATPVEDMAVKLNGISSKAANLVDLAFNNYKTKKDINGIDLKKVTDVLKTTYELERLAKGESTENIATYIKAEGLQDLDTFDLIEKLNNQRSGE